MQTLTRLLFVAAMTLVWCGAFPQTGKPRVSPAQTESYTIGKAKITIDYSSPSVRDRTAIFNNLSDQWGAFKYDSTKDQLRVDVFPRVAADSMEVLAYNVTNEGFSLSWEKLVIPVPVN